MNRRKHTVIDRSHHTGDLRPKTSRKHSLKPVHIFLWQWMWGRQQILPDEQYIESQLAAARHFQIDRSTVSRQLDVLTKAGAIIELKGTKRGSDGFWTSKVIKVTEPPASPQALRAKMHTDEVIENAGVSSMCKNAPQSSKDSTAQSTKNTPYTGSNSRTTTDDDYVSGANLHTDEVIENKASSPSANLHMDRIALADQIVAAKRQLTEYQQAAAKTLAEFGDDGGWSKSIEATRARIRELERKYDDAAARTQ
jgi:hypothetical protein